MLQWDGLFSPKSIVLGAAAWYRDAQEHHVRRVERNSSTHAAKDVELALGWDMVPIVDIHCVHMLYIFVKHAPVAPALSSQPLAFRARSYGLCK